MFFPFNSWYCIYIYIYVFTTALRLRATKITVRRFRLNLCSFHKYYLEISPYGSFDVVRCRICSDVPYTANPHRPSPSATGSTSIVSDSWPKYFEMVVIYCLKWYEKEIKDSTPGNLVIYGFNLFVLQHISWKSISDIYTNRVTLRSENLIVRCNYQPITYLSTKHPKKYEKKRRLGSEPVPPNPNGMNCSRRLWQRHPYRGRRGFVARKSVHVEENGLIKPCPMPRPPLTFPAWTSSPSTCGRCGGELSASTAADEPAEGDQRYGDGVGMAGATAEDSRRPKSKTFRLTKRAEREGERRSRRNS